MTSPGQGSHPPRRSRDGWARRFPGLSTLRSSSLAFAVATAGGLVALRLLCFDYRYFLQMRSVPSHDLAQAVSLFATSMHSLRLTGEIAWWNPLTDAGYAQYYQAFLGPLAPTPHHIVFIVWAQLVAGLGALGIRIPEYPQYLAMTYVVLPFFAFAAFTSFAGLIFRRRVTVLLVALVYAFSGIGLWNAAWFYFQEPFTLFFLLATTLALLQHPTRARLAWFLAALLVQVASLNYWSLYDSWFVGVMVGAYCLTHPREWRRLYGRARRWFRGPWLLTPRATVAAIVVLVTAGLWVAVLTSIVIEQAPRYLRGGGGIGYSVERAYFRVAEIRRFTIELFEPRLTHPDNPMHGARYIGAFLVPLLMVVTFVRWAARERWLIASAVAVFGIALAPSLLLGLWEATPLMSRILHMFYFYSHFWQLLVLLLAGAGLDVLLLGRHPPGERRRLVWALGGLVVAVLLALLGYLMFTERSSAWDASLDANLRFTLVTLTVAAVALQIVRFPAAANRRLFVIVLLVIACADLTRYFWDVGQADRRFSDQHWRRPPELAGRVHAALRRPWTDPNPERGFEADLTANLPIRTDMWPENRFLEPGSLVTLQLTDPAAFSRLIEGPALEWSGSATPHPDSPPAGDLRFDASQPSLWAVSNMEPLPGGGRWRIGANPTIASVPRLDTCLGRYSHVFVRMAATSDIEARQMDVVLELDGRPVRREIRLTIPLVPEYQLHSYVRRLDGFRPTDRLSGVRLAPVGGPSSRGPNQVEIADFRLIGSPRDDACAPETRAGRVMRYRWRRWSYNGFAFDVDSRRPGWLLIRQLYDPRWRAVLDGRRVPISLADGAAMAVPIAEGRHTLALEYRPRARALYWPACALLELSLATLAAVALVPGRRPPPGLTR